MAVCRRTCGSVLAEERACLATGVVRAAFARKQGGTDADVRAVVAKLCGRDDGGGSDCDDTGLWQQVAVSVAAQHEFRVLRPGEYVLTSSARRAARTYPLAAVARPRPLACPHGGQTVDEARAALGRTAHAGVAVATPLGTGARCALARGAATCGSHGPRSVRDERRGHDAQADRVLDKKLAHYAVGAGATVYVTRRGSGRAAAAAAAAPAAGDFLRRKTRVSQWCADAGHIFCGAEEHAACAWVRTVLARVARPPDAVVDKRLAHAGFYPLFAAPDTRRQAHE